MIVTLSEPGNSRQDAHNFGTITYNLTPPLLPPTLNEYLDAVGGDDNDDYFQFSLEQRLGVGLNLSLPVGVTLELLDNLGEVIVSQSNPVEPFNTFPLPVSLKNNLDAGTYYIHLFSENADATPYDFDLRVAPPDNAGDFAEEANNLGILTATPVLSDDYVGSSSSYNDEDYYQFTLSELSNVNFELIDGDDNFTSLQIYSGTNTFTNPIDSLFNISSENLATLEKTLVTGIYTVRVTGNGLYNPSTNDSNLASYALSLSATPSTQIDPGNSLEEAHNFGTITYNLTPPLLPPTLNEYLDAVGGDDNDDYFQFSLDQGLGIELNLSLSRGVTLEILDNAGEVILSKSNPVDPFNDYPLPVSLKNNLDAGTYYIHLFSDNADPTIYDFDLIVAPPDNAGDSAEEANNLGMLNTTPVVVEDYVASSSSYDDQDYYQFTLNELSTVNFELTDGDNNFTDLDIYAGTDTFTNPIDSLSNNEENTVTLEKTLAAGIYTVVVSGNGLYNPSINDSNLASYALSLSANPSTQIDPGNSLEEAHNFGTITYNLTPPLLPPTLNEYLDTVGREDNDDYFQFSLDQRLGVEVNLSLLRGVTIELLDDSGEVILSESNPIDPFNDYPLFVFLKDNLDAGTYYIHVFSDNPEPTIYDFDLMVAPPDNAGDFGEEANDLGILTATPVIRDDSVGFSFNNYDDEDIYQFTLSESSTVNLELTDGDNNATNLQIYSGTDTFGSPLDSLFNSYSENFTSLQIALAAGTYTVRVGGDGGYNESIDDYNLASYSLSVAATEDPDPVLTISNTTIVEGDDGTTNAFFTVSLTPAASSIVTVDYSTGDDTAFAGSDYVATSGTLTFNPGELNQTISIPIIGDDVVEETEQFFVNLANPANAAILTSQGIGTIIDSDVADVDLVISSPSSDPITAKIGDNLTFTWTVTNNGTDATTADRWFDHIYISDDDIYDVNDTYVTDYVPNNLSLNPGQSYEVTRFVTLPETDIGDRYLLMITDLANQQTETDETNNTIAIPLQLEAAPDIDLIVSAIEAPTEAVGRQNIDLSWTVENQGTADSTKAMTDYIYLSPNNIIGDEDDILIRSPLFEETVIAGGSRVRTTNLFLPNSLEDGDYYLVIGTDHNNNIFETDETNNFNITEQPLTIASPDLTVSSVNIPSTVLRGETFDITWTVENIGLVDTVGGWSDYLYLSTDQELGNEDDILLTSYFNEPIAAGNSVENTVTTTISPNVEEGNYYVLVDSDRFNSIPERDETNNLGISAETITISSSGIDFIVSTIDAPTEAVRGESITISWTVENIGTVDAAEFMSDYIYLSPNNIIGDGDDIFISSPFFDETVTAGSSRVRTINLFLPNSLEDGDYYIVIGTDHNNNIAETDETNNFNITEQPLTIASPDLVVSSVNIPSTALRGDTIDITWTVENIGLVDTVGGWSDYLYLSTDQELGNEDDILLTSYFNEPIAAGNSVENTVTTTIFPNIEEGNYYILVDSDRFDEILETDETNNQRISTETLNISSPDVDLIVSEIETPAEGVRGESINISWTVENQGSVDTTEFMVDYIYLSPNDIVGDEDDIFIDRFFFDEIVTAGDSSIRTTDLFLPRSLENGDYYVVIGTDSENNIIEKDDTNNFKITEQIITITSPDLIVSDVIAPVEGLSGQEIEVSWTITNEGNAVTNRSWYDSIYFSEDTTIDFADTRLENFEFTGTLNPGESITRVQTVTLPVDFQGEGYIGVKVDDFSYIIESNEENNAEIDPQGVTGILAPYPNLIVSEINAPINAFTKQQIPIEWTVTNIGNGATNASYWTDEIWLSVDTVLDSSDTYLGRVRNPSYLESGQSYTNNLMVNVPKNVQGNYYFIVETDDGNQVFEFESEDDNSNFGGPTIIEPSPIADLQVIDVNGPMQVFSGQSTEVTYTVSNEGEGDTIEEGWSDRIYLSSDQVIDENDYLVGSHRRHTIYEIYVTDTYFNGSGDLDREYLYTTVTSDSYSSAAVSNLILNLERPLTSKIFNAQEGVYFYEQIGFRNTRVETYPGQLNAGENYQVTKNVTLPIGVSGEFYFLVETDINNEVDEQVFESNNTGSTTELTTVRLTPPPDLELEFLNVPNTALASHGLTIDFRVTNFGTETPNSFWRDTFYLSEDDQLDRETDLKLGDYLNYQRLGIVNSNEQFINSYDGEVTFTLPDEITGDYYLFAVTDSEDHVFELDNDNNIVRHSNFISLESRPADLIITNLAVIGALEAGKGIQVQWTVENVGIGDTAVNNWSDQIIASIDDILGNDDDIILGTIRHQLRTVNDGGNIITVPFLNPGESYSKSEIINLPITLVGDYHLFAVTDVNNNVYEATNEDNNSRHIPVSITRETADLQVTELTVANSVNSGKSLTVNYAVQNLGIAETNNNTWRDRIYLSTDTELGDSNDILLGTVYRSQKLASLENYIISHDFTIPIDLEGDYYVIVETDSNNNVLEDPSENNNTKVSVNPTNIILSEVPDLVITEVASPDTAISGQQVNISWNTYNDGEDIIEGTWRTTLYLSRDQIFEPNLDTYLGYANYQGDLLSGETLNQSNSFLIPRGLSGQLYVFAVTDNNNKIYEREGESNNVAYDGTSMTVSLAPPADLVVRNITVPVNGVPGELTTIEYTIENQGNSPALGNWRDEVYISADSVWDLNDRKLGTVNVTGPVASGESYTESLTAKLPGVVPANYYVIVRSDIRNAIPEPDESNNIAASSETFLVDTNVLEMDVPRTGTLGRGESVYYRMDAPVGETLQLKFDSASLNGANELYLRYGEMPTRTEYDFSFSEAFAPDQEIIVPNTKGGSYYVLAYGDRGLSAEYTIEAEILDFSLLDVGTDYGSNRGQVTTTLLGAEFTSDTDVRLIAGDGTTREAVQLWWKDQTELWATFDLQGLDTGLYDVQVIDGAETAILEDSFTVTDGVVGEAEITMSAPPALRPGQAGVITIAYRNVGETDIVAPLITLAAENANLRSPDSSNITASELQFLGINSEGPAGILAPGATEVINVVFNPTGGNGSSVGFTLSQIKKPNNTFDLTSFKESLRPDGITDQEWNNIWQNFINSVGDTAADYNNLLAENANHLSLIDSRTNDIARLLNFELLEASGYGSLIGRNKIGLLGRNQLDLPLLKLRAIRDENGDVIISDSEFTISFELQEDGTYLSDSITSSSLEMQDNQLKLFDSLGNIFAFRDDGYLDFIEGSNDNRLQTTFSNGLLTKLTGPDGSEIIFEYNDFGRISKIITDLEQYSFSYDNTGEYLVSSTNTNGTIEYSYETSVGLTQGAIRSITQPDGIQQVFDYDSFGRLISQGLSDGSETLTYEYDSTGIITVTDTLGASQQQLFNDSGQLGRSIDALGRVTQYRYDSSGNLVEIVLPDGTSTVNEYDEFGNLSSLTDAQGNIVSFFYNPATNLLESVQDALGNATVRYTYDDQGNITSTTYADGTVERFTYDAQGNQVEIVNRLDQSIQLLYNEQNQLTQKIWDDGTQFNFIYNNEGYLVSLTDPQGTTSLEYDSNNRLSKIIYPNGRFLAYSYDLVGRRTQLVNQDGFTINYAYNNRGRLASLTDGDGETIVAYSYDEVGRLIREDNGNETYTTYTYDIAGQITSIVNYAPDNTINSRFDYTYNNQGLRDSTNTLEGVWQYDYDSIGQLISVTSPSGRVIDYRYDAVGNRVTVTDDGIESDYISNNLNQYTETGDLDFTYDANGNLSSKTVNGQTWTYNYNIENRLIAVDGPDGSWSYEYDALGNRVASVHDGQRTEYLVDPFGISGLSDVIGEYDQNGDLYANYIHGIGLETRVDATDSATYFDFDAVGSTAGLTSSLGSYLNQYSYLPFGEEVTKTEAVDNPFEYVGQWGVMNEGNGLNFMRFRFFDSSQGRFISPDPLGLAAGNTNLYQYTDNNPISFNDPSGLLTNSDYAGIEQFFGPLAAPYIYQELDSYQRNINNELEKLKETVQNYIDKLCPNQSTEGFLDIAIGAIGFSGALGSAGLVKLVLIAATIYAGSAAVGVAAAGVAAVAAATAAYKAGQQIGKGIDKVYNDFYGRQSSYYDPSTIKSVEDVLTDKATLEKLTTSVIKTLDKKFPLSKKDAIRIAGELAKENCKHPDPEDLPKDPDQDNDPQKDNTDIVAPSDPNDILGPEGFGEERWITASETLPYTIRFENQETATAPAQQVIITHPLDSDLDFRTFRLGNFGWSDYYFEVPENSAFYQETIDLTEEEGFVVEVVAGVDIEAGEAFWNITTLDPETGQTPEDALTGFLLPNNEEGVGDGFVTYTIKSSRNAQSGDIIDAEATIIFDTEEPIDTPPIFNTIDAEIPTSTVNPLPEPNENHEFLVSWTGNDDLEGSGLQGYNIYVSDNGGDYTLWLENTQLTEALFTGTPGHSYDFYSVAFDNAGNHELTPAEAQASVAIANNEITLDIDGNSILELQDYNLIDLYASELDETEFDFLINNFSNDLIGENATRPDANSILSYFNEVGDTLLDIDGNTQVEIQDYNLIDLYASQLDVVELGFLIDNYSNDLIGENATRPDADSILTYFETIVPETV